MRVAQYFNVFLVAPNIEVVELLLAGGLPLSTVCSSFPITERSLFCYLAWPVNGVYNFIAAAQH